MFIVYTFFIDDTPVYVGQGGMQRLKDHLRPSDRGYVSPVLRGARANGQLVHYLVEEYATRAEAHTREQELIAKYRRTIDGGTLLNKGLGGPGSYGAPVSKETRQRLSMVQLGRPHTLERNRNISKAMIGHKKSDDTKAKMSEVARSRPRLQCPHCELQMSSQLLSRHIAARHK